MDKIMEQIINFFLSSIKPIAKFFKKSYSRWKNRNKFFVDDYKNIKEDKIYYYSKKIGNDRYGVFCTDKKEPERIYKRPEHDNPKKLSKQYAKKLAWKKANNIK